jgi:hypothetical protein
VQQNFITDDTEALQARVNQQYRHGRRFARRQVRPGGCPDEERRQLNLLKLSLVLPAPSDPKEAES